jgi:hypothetical protein
MSNRSYIVWIYATEEIGIALRWNVRWRSRILSKHPDMRNPGEHNTSAWTGIIYGREKKKKRLIANLITAPG